MLNGMVMNELLPEVVLIKLFNEDDSIFVGKWPQTWWQIIVTWRDSVLFMSVLFVRRC